MAENFLKQMRVITVDLRSTKNPNRINTKETRTSRVKVKENFKKQSEQIEILHLKEKE